MPLQPVARRSLGDQVFDQLSAQILHDELSAGSTLPAERALVELLGVNRQAVREAIKRLEQAGLVDVLHGGGTTVTDWRHRAGLDLLPALIVTADGAIDSSVVRSIMEFRAAVGPEVAARCAERAVPAIKAELTDLDERYQRVGDTTSLKELGELDIDLWTTLVDGSDNIAFRLAYNALRVQTAAADGLVLHLLVDEVNAIEQRRQLLHHTISGDVSAARAAAAALLSIGTAAMTKAIAGVPTLAPRSLQPRGTAR